MSRGKSRRRESGQFRGLMTRRRLAAPSVPVWPDREFEGEGWLLLAGRISQGEEVMILGLPRAKNLNFQECPPSLRIGTGTGSEKAPVPNGAGLRADVSKTGTVPERGLSQVFAARTTTIS